MLDVVKITVPTTGNAGAAIGTASSRPISGAIKAIKVDWSSSAPGTSDITITIDSDDNHPATALYAKANSATDAMVYPLVQATGTDGAGIASWYVEIVGQGPVKVVVGDCDALAAAVVVTVFVEGRD